MGRMHSKGKGMSGSALPYKRTPPSWLKVTSHEVWPTCACQMTNGYPHHFSSTYPIFCEVSPAL